MSRAGPEPDPRRHRPGDRREPRDPLHEGHARAADVRLLRPHRRRPAGARRAVRGRRHPARPAHPPGALGPLAVADDPAALRQRRARRRLRHRHRDVRERRAGRDARRRAARGAEPVEAARRRRRARWASRTACPEPRRPLARGTLPPCPSRRSPTRPCVGTGARLAILDQTLLPGAEVWLALEGARRHGAGHPAPGRARRAAHRGRRRLRAGDGGRAACPGLGHARARLGAAARGAADRGQPGLRRRPRARRGAGGGAGRRWRRAARDGGRAHPRRGGRRLGGDRRPRRRAAGRARAGSPRTATPAPWPPAARARRWR